MKERTKGTLHARRVGIICGMSTILVMAVCWVALAASKPVKQDIPQVSQCTADHKKIEKLNQPMKHGPDVTSACLSCHTEAAKQVQQTIHWSWAKKEKGKEAMGKAHILNNF